MTKFYLLIWTSLFSLILFISSCSSDSNDDLWYGDPGVPKIPFTYSSFYHEAWTTNWQELEIYRTPGREDILKLNAYDFRFINYSGNFYEFKVAKNGWEIEGITVKVPIFVNNEWYSPYSNLKHPILLTYQPDQREITLYDFSTWETGGRADYQVLEINEETGTSSVISYSEPIESMETISIRQSKYSDLSYNIDQYTNHLNQHRIKYLGKISDKYGRIPIIYTGKEQPDEVILLGVDNMNTYIHPQYEELTKDLVFTTD